MKISVKYLGLTARSKRLIYLLIHSFSVLLRHFFCKYGWHLCTCTKQIRETPHKRHHKFIEFYDVRAAEAALKSLNRSDIAGKRIKLEPSRPGGARRKCVFWYARLYILIFFIGTLHFKCYTCKNLLWSCAPPGLVGILFRTLGTNSKNLLRS